MVRPEAGWVQRRHLQNFAGVGVAAVVGPASAAGWRPCTSCTAACSFHATAAPELGGTLSCRAQRQWWWRQDCWARSRCAPTSHHHHHLWHGGSSKQMAPKLFAIRDCHLHSHPAVRCSASSVLPVPTANKPLTSRCLRAAGAAGGVAAALCSRGERRVHRHQRPHEANPGVCAHIWAMAKWLTCSCGALSAMHAFQLDYNTRSHAEFLCHDCRRRR